MTTVSRARPFLTRELQDWALIVLLGASLGLNVFLGSHHRHSRPASRPSLSLGARLPSLSAEDIAGWKTRIDWATDSRPTLVYIFSPSCIWCARNFESMTALTEHVKENYRVIGISLIIRRSQ